ncbi:hypothetical protein PHLCEN_2v13240 [Hermanssonia centrifuga]|uniref:Uncharacterized protein n=1 Tax=Hermanssonia centrifuga TaxID=98765 RepID=A0A2R6NF44_9APHY|nr:hypothetical protein PHLCEN_2v13240 [Hermanssonia centrifuga]
MPSLRQTLLLSTLALAALPVHTFPAGPGMPTRPEPTPLIVPLEPGMLLGRHYYHHQPPFPKREPLVLMDPALESQFAKASPPPPSASSHNAEHPSASKEKGGSSGKKEKKKTEKKGGATTRRYGPFPRYLAERKGAMVQMRDDVNDVSNVGPSSRGGTAETSSSDSGALAPPAVPSNAFITNHMNGTDHSPHVDRSKAQDKDKSVQKSAGKSSKSKGGKESKTGY